MAEKTETAQPSATAHAPVEPARARAGQAGRRGPGRREGWSRKGAPDRERRSEFDQKIVDIRRVARVVAGGRRFSFSVAMVIGDRNGRVGVGLGKAPDTAFAITKAARNAKKNLISVPITKEGTIAHDVEAKMCASRIVIRPKNSGGLIAGSAARAVLELAGVRRASAKILSRSKNKINNARAAIRALSELSG